MGMGRAWGTSLTLRIHGLADDLARLPPSPTRSGGIGKQQGARTVSPGDGSPPGDRMRSVERADGEVHPSCEPSADNTIPRPGRGYGIERRSLARRRVPPFASMRALPNAWLRGRAVTSAGEPQPRSRAPRAREVHQPVRSAEPSTLPISYDGPGMPWRIVTESPLEGNRGRRSPPPADPPADLEGLGLVPRHAQARAPPRRHGGRGGRKGAVLPRENRRRPREWARSESNRRPTGYEPAAPPLSYGP